MRMRLAIGVACFTLLAGPALAQSADVGFAAGDIVFRHSPIPGADTAVLLGGVDKPGLYTFRVRLDKGARIPPHTHTDARMITVLSGDLFAGQGSTFDPTSGRLYSAGSFFLVPAGAPHFTYAPNGEAVYQEQGFGPTPTAYIPQ